MSMLDVALDCIRRGWYVFPCWPRDKKPMTKTGWKAATLDENQVRAWWARTPDANPAIATGPSGLRVVDFDHGLTTLSDFVAWSLIHPGVDTYIVRTGRRPEFGLQVYFQDDGTGRSLGGWELDGCKGDVRAAGGYVMAAGSVHPSGEKYEALNEPFQLATVPGWVRELKPVRESKDREPGQKINEGEGRHDYLTSVAGSLRNKGLDTEALYAALLPINETMCDPPLPEEDVRHIADSVGRYALPEVAPVATIGLKTDDRTEVASEPADPMAMFDTPEQILNADPVDFVINNIIPKNRYTGFVALSGSRKTIIACNLIRSALTGVPFLDKFPVDNPPERVLFFAAESARSELKDRAEKMGFVPYLQSRKLLIRSAATNGQFHQDLIPDSLLNGALVIFDTFIRFFDGVSEQDATEARKFSAQMQRIVNAGATVIVLFHAPKGSRDADEMTVETIRGSSELGAAMAACWGLAMLGSDWADNTRMTQVKRREFECDPPLFDFSCDMNTAICSYVAEATTGAGKKKQDDSAARAAAAEILATNPETGINKLRELLKERGFPVGNKRVGEMKSEILNRHGSTVSETKDLVPIPIPDPNKR
jgi:hypothetical protein